MSDCRNATNSICPCGSFTHPSVIFNPPSRDFIAYRVGDFSSFRHALLQASTDETELSSTVSGQITQIWRPGGHGDLALQMIEWWAYLADILTFYNERVASQAYLRTADSPESVKRLVQLLGYRPRPGIGAKGVLAALASSPLPFTLPAGFGIQSKPGPGKQPQVFELNTDTTVGATPTGPGSAALALGSVGAHPIVDAKKSPITKDNIVLAGTSSAVKKGDKVLILPKDLATTTSFALATVLSVTAGKDPSIGAITSIQVKWEPNAGLVTDLPNLQLYRGGQSTQVWQYPAGDGKVVRNKMIDLESLVRSIKGKDPILFESSKAIKRLTVKSTTEILWYANPGEPSPLDPTQPQPKDSNIPSIPITHTRVATEETVDLNGMSDTQDNRVSFFVWHSWTEVGDLIVLPPSTVGDDAISSGQATAVILEPSFGAAFPDVLRETKVLVGDSVGNGASGAINSDGELVLDAPVPLLISPLQTYFNLLPVSRGKTVTSEVLGSGNASISGQDFVLQNSPVTYLQSNDSRSGGNYSSTVRVWVNGLEWAEVQSFFGQTPSAQIFITHEDDQGKTHVVFGDGEFGARLPTGVNNIVASYRYGSGAEVPDAGTLTVVLKPQPGLRSIRNPVAVGGGSDPDPSAKLRRLAPRSVLTFNRAVSADDYEVIAAQAPGVTRAAAMFAFDPVEQRPRVMIWVGDDAGAVTAAQTAIAAAADPNRLPAVVQATRIQITLRVSIVIDPRRTPQIVLDAVRSALLDPDSGLLGLNVIAIGQSIYDSQIYAACVAVPGVLSVRGLEFSSSGAHARPDLLLGGFRKRGNFLSAGGSLKRPGFFASASHKPSSIHKIPRPNVCAEHRHDAGAGAYFFLPNDGRSLTFDTETA